MSKSNYVGAPAIFKLEMACKQINDAFGGFGCFLVGSAIERPDWRDVDIRYIIDDADFIKLFPNCSTESALWEFDPRWTLLTVAIASWMREQTGLPIDFQIQPQTFANARHDKTRHAIGLRGRKTRLRGKP